MAFEPDIAGLYANPYWFLSDALLVDFWRAELDTIAQLLNEHPELPQLFDVPEASRVQRNLCHRLLAHRGIIVELENTAGRRYLDIESPDNDVALALRKTYALARPDAPGWVLEVKRTVDQLPLHLIEAMPEALRTAGGDPADNHRIKSVHESMKQLSSVALLREFTANVISQQLNRLARRWPSEVPTSQRFDPPPERTDASSSVDNTTAFAHSPDYRSVSWRGENFSFTARQAAAVGILHESFTSGTPDVGQDRVLEDIGSQEKPLPGTRSLKPASRLRDIFRNHRAWGSLVVRGCTKGTYRLAP